MSTTRPLPRSLPELSRGGAQRLERRPGLRPQRFVPGQGRLFRRASGRVVDGIDRGPGRASFGEGRRRLASLRREHPSPRAAEKQPAPPDPVPQSRNPNDVGRFIAGMPGTEGSPFIGLNGVSFTDANTGTAVGDSGAILRTRDGGATWKLQFSGTNNWLDSPL